MSKEPIIIPAYRITENGSVLVSRELEIPTDSEPLTITLPTNEIDRLRAELETAQADKAEAIVMARANTEARIAAWLLRDPDGVNSDAALMIARGYYLNRKGADDGK